MYLFALKAQYLKSVEIMMNCKNELLLKMGTPPSLS